MNIGAGILRHRVSLQKPVKTQGASGGETVTWQNITHSIPAAVLPVSGREYLAGNQVQGQITTKIIIRFRQGVDQTCRVLHQGRIYNIEAALPDDDSGREHMTLMCSAGVNAG